MKPHSQKPASTAYVWIWLPDAVVPVVCGRIDLVDGIYRFTYGRSYVARADAIPIWLPELPLGQGVIIPDAPHVIAGALRDAAPDQWGRRVVLNRQFDHYGHDVDTGELDELNYLLLSGSDRIGALDFQTSATQYHPRLQHDARLVDLLQAADCVEQGIALSPELDDALRHGTSIGGARPKAQLRDGDRKLIAKFSSSRDVHNVVGGEFIAMRIARMAGLDVANVALERVEGKDILLVERFDRVGAGEAWYRKPMVSSLTLQGLDENAARYASYPDVAAALRRTSAQPAADQRELWSRMCFNIIVGNTDDHARNHACFWDGAAVRLTPAYDIDPRPRLGREANQAMKVHGEDRRSLLAVALAAAGGFGVADGDALGIAVRQVQTVLAQFRPVATKAGLTVSEQDRLARRAFLNPYIFEGAPAALTKLARKF